MSDLLDLSQWDSHPLYDAPLRGAQTVPGGILTLAVSTRLNDTNQPMFNKEGSATIGRTFFY